MFQCLHHVAYRCDDAQATVDFYTKVIGLEYVAGLAGPEGKGASWPLIEDGKPARKVLAAPADAIHIFFKLGDGSYLAFFDVASSPQQAPDPNTPWWINHIAFETADMQSLLAAKARLEAKGVQVLGPKNHDFCQSIYFYDPNGHRLEITVRSETPETWPQLIADAPGQLERWNALKTRKYDYRPATTPEVIPAMPSDATVVAA